MKKEYLLDVIKNYLEGSIEYHVYQTYEDRSIHSGGTWIPGEELEILHKILEKLGNPYSQIWCNNYGTNIFLRIKGPGIKSSTPIDLLNSEAWEPNTHEYLKKCAFELFMLRNLEYNAKERCKYYVLCRESLKALLSIILTEKESVKDDEFLCKIIESLSLFQLEDGNVKQSKDLLELFLKAYYN